MLLQARAIPRNLLTSCRWLPAILNFCKRHQTYVHDTEKLGTRLKQQHRYSHPLPARQRGSPAKGEAQATAAASGAPAAPRGAELLRCRLPTGQRLAGAKQSLVLSEGAGYAERIAAGNSGSHIQQVGINTPCPQLLDAPGPPQPRDC